MPPQPIDEVLTRLDEIIAEARRRQSRNGYFAALYRDVTARVAAAIEAGEFEDDARMERLDVAFAQRYFDALEERDTEAGPPRSWARTFEAAERWRPLILQHLLLRVNTHVNLDLGITAVEVVPGDEIADLKADFYRINRILGAMIEEVQARTSRVSPWTGVLDRLGGTADEIISNFCLVRAREDARDVARTLAPLDTDQRAQLIRAKDRETARRTDAILRSGGVWIVPALVGIRLWEEDHVPSVIAALSSTGAAPVLRRNAARFEIQKRPGKRDETPPGRHPPPQSRQAPHNTPATSSQWR